MLIKGLFVTLVGLTLNGTVFFLNGGMPCVGLVEPYGKWIPITAETKLAILSDIIRTPYGSYTSAGDVVLWIGFAIVVAAVARWGSDTIIKLWR